MKKTTNSMLISALILFCTGLLLTLITAIYTTAAGVDIFSGTGSSNPNVRDYSKTFADMGYTQNDTIKKIDFSFLVGDVEVLSTQEESRVEFYQTDINNIVCKFENDTITIKETNSVGFMGFEINEKGVGFNGLRQLFRSVGNASMERKVVLYLNPQDFNGVLNVNCVVGNILCRDLTCSELYTKSTAANVTVLNSRVNTALNVQGMIGDVFIRENEFLQCRVNVTNGKIYAYVDENKCNFETTLGDIFILTEQSSTDYQLRLSNTTGAIRPFDYESKNNEFSLYSEKNNSIWAKSIIGSIVVCEFDREKYPQIDYSVFSDLTKLPS